VDPLAWLGLRSSRSAHPNLSAIAEKVAQLLPDDEAVVRRYIVVVAVLLAKVAQSDGRFMECELDQLRNLFRHIDRMPASGIDALCTLLDERVPNLTEAELGLCYRELKSLCDGAERRQVLRLLASQATADGHIVPSEHGALVEIAQELGVTEPELADLEIEAIAGGELPLPPDSLVPSLDSVAPSRPSGRG
jgi:uncharacterized tellurite resistance protein B-like protein